MFIAIYENFLTINETKGYVSDKNVLTKRVEPHKFRIITGIIACHFIKNILFVYSLVNSCGSCDHNTVYTFVVWIKQWCKFSGRAPG